MIKVLIAEDEPPIRRNLIKLIEKLNGNFNVVATAADGDEAISLLENTQVDVIFTDIRMPIKDGFDLLTYTTEHHPHVRTIIISGYAEFEYARKALKYQVTDYLLKPVSIDHLEKLLATLEAEMNQCKKQQEEEYMHKLLHNDTMDTITHAGLNYPCYGVLMCCAGSYPILSTDDMLGGVTYWKHVKEDHHLSLHDTPFLKDYWLFNGESGAEQVFIFAMDDIETDKWVALASSFYDQLPTSLPLTAICSGLLRKPTAIYKYSKHLQSILYKKIVLGMSQFIMENASPIETTYYESLLGQDTKEKLSLAIAHSREELLEEQLRELFNKWEEKCYPQIIVDKLIRNIFTLCEEHTSICYEPSEIEVGISEAISYAWNYHMLYENLWDLFQGLIPKSDSRQTDRHAKHNILKPIECYILDNYTEPITHQSLSKRFGLTASYLSRLYREYKGQSPSEHLTSLRIHKAKEIIQANPTILTKEVAGLVGYSDPFYFSKIFKKISGLSPADYKKYVK